MMKFCVYMTIFWFCMAKASDPSPLQDFCVAPYEPNSAVFVNGKICKNPKYVEVNDFIYKGFNIPGNTNNIQKSTNKRVGVDAFPGLNTLGISFGRVDFAPSGLNVPHIHPRSSEIFTVIEGMLYAGFVTSDNQLFDTVITEGDIMVFPQALVHFQLNIGNTYAYAITAFGSQNPGRVDVPNAIFGTTPRIIDDVLTKAFQASVKEIEYLRSQFINRSVVIDSGRSIQYLLFERSKYVNKDNA